MWLTGAYARDGTPVNTGGARPKTASSVRTVDLVFQIDKYAR